METLRNFPHKKVSGLSGNEIFCLSKVGIQPGQLCIGNSVVALGVMRGLGAGLSTLGGGEVSEVTQLVHDGRMKAFDRMMVEAKQNPSIGITGVSFDLINHGGNLEFLTVGSTVHNESAIRGQNIFSTSADAQQLYCQIDSGFKPIHFVFGNVAYSIGVGGNIMGGLKRLKRGEVTEYSQIFDDTRHLALSRISAEAKKHRANSVVGIQTTITPLFGTQEMMMIGTASSHPALESYSENPVTSDMTNEEMWNLVNLGYLPLRLVMGVSVYSLGFTGGIMSALQSLGGGEVDGLTEILYEAREKALARIEREAERIGADEVIGVKTRIYDLGGGLVEFMAMGTAVKKFPNVTTISPSLLPQAIIRDQDTFVDDSEGGNVGLNSSKAASSVRLQRGPVSIIAFIMIIAFYILKIVLHHS